MSASHIDQFPCALVYSAKDSNSQRRRSTSPINIPEVILGADQSEGLATISGRADRRCYVIHYGTHATTSIAAPKAFENPSSSINRRCGSCKASTCACSKETGLSINPNNAAAATRRLTGILAMCRYGFGKLTAPPSSFTLAPTGLLRTQHQGPHRENNVKIVNRWRM